MIFEKLDKVEEKLDKLGKYLKTVKWVIYETKWSRLRLLCKTWGNQLKGLKMAWVLQMDNNNNIFYLNTMWCDVVVYDITQTE